MYMTQPFRAVLVGCGAISGAWFKGVSTVKDLEIVGLVDLLESNAQKRKEEFAPNAVTGTNLATVLNQVKPDIVFDCTIPASHFEVVTTALEHGCHVLGEKPMADNLEQAKAMIAAAQKAGKLFAVMQNWRYTHNIRRLKKFLDTGVLGNITTINADFYVGAHFGGFREQMAHILLKDMAIHTFDASRFLTSQNPKGVYAMEWNPEGSWYSRDASAAAIFEMTGNVIFNYRGSWCSEGQRTPWESEWRIIGTKGSIRWDGNTNITCEIVGDEPEEQAFFREQHNVEVPVYDDINKRPEGHAAVIHAFVEALRTNTQPETVCTDNIKSLAMVYGAVESAEKGEKVKVEG
jgi:predicted dehydrogenase